MNAPIRLDVTRRALLAAGGAVIVSFALSRAGLAQEGELAGGGNAKLPGSLRIAPMLDSWIGIDSTGRITVFTGKCELGQGIATALMQCAAEELAVDFASINLVTADTERTPNEGFTAGSHSMQDSGTAILNAAAQVRGILIELAATRLGVDAGTLSARDGAIVAADGKSVPYGDLVTGQELHRQAQPQSPLIEPKNFRVIGQDVPRIDIPGKLTGAPMYVQDMRPDGMLHARVLRPPSYGAKLTTLDSAPVLRMPGVVNVVRDGSFVAVVARGEWQAINAMNALSEHARWDENGKLPPRSDIYNYLQALPANDTVILDKGTRGQGQRRLKATYLRPYQSHGSIGPSCALALFAGGKMTVWTHTQGVFPLRGALAQMLGLPPQQVHCIQVEGSGCYGHNAADDVAADAALIARAMPGQPIRVQWMREDEFGWEPYGPVMVMKAEAAVDDAGKLVDWNYEVWSNTHTMRPGSAGNLLPAQYLQTPFAPDAPMPIPQPEGGGDRNAIPLYTLPNARVVSRFIPAMPLRVSALRGLGAYANVFALESFMDEMAQVAQADPVEFRLRHLDDPRARDVVTRAAREFGWDKNDKMPAGTGRGFAFARYKNLGAYCALALNVTVDRDSGEIRIGRVVAAVDSGQAVNPDGIRNQIEGSIIQSMTWSIVEEVTWGDRAIESRDWSGYPMLRFPSMPAKFDVHVIDRPGAPFLGTGEAGQGPAGAAIANAVAHATGARIRQLPLSPQRVRAALAP